MYEDFFGLTERPFELTPNPRYLCRTPQHREALSTLEYGITSARGITLLLGDAGTGKTTLIYTALAMQEQKDALCVRLANPTLSRGEFIQFLAEEFNLGSAAAESKTTLLREMSRLLLERRARGALTCLVIDEAQSLSHELLEEVRLLANLETAEQKLMPVILAGQPELGDRLNEPSLRQLKQRIALRTVLTPLSLVETASYIRCRINVAGGDPIRAFTQEAVRHVHAYSGGIPRTISVVCDNALIAGFANGEAPVRANRVDEVCRDLDLKVRAPQPAKPSEPTFLAPPTAATSMPEPALREEPASVDSREMFSTQRRERRFSFFGR